MEDLNRIYNNLTMVLNELSNIKPIIDAFKEYLQADIVLKKEDKFYFLRRPRNNTPIFKNIFRVV